MPRLRSILLVTIVAASPVLWLGRAAAQDDGGSRADAERQLQRYLAIWSNDALVTATAVDHFYAPSVSYYGRDFDRAQVLADKRAFIRSFPRRSYREVPGSFVGTCDAGRDRCRVTAEVDWQRTDRLGRTTAGRSRLAFDFVPAEGGRKIAREGARTL